MPAVPTVSPVTGNPVPPYYIHTAAGHFLDTSGRTLLLRGVNLSGDSKYPTGHNSHTLDGFWESGESGKVSFVGRPFPLNEADVHLERLRGWGMTLIRYVVCWEALEHAGPKKYDEDFIDYTIAVLRKCKDYGFKVYMDPHQDVWSRFSGGSGAPFWTLHACGLDPRYFTATGSLIHNEYPDPNAPDPDNFPVMSWPTSYYRLPSLTLFTLFFGGRDYAPKCIIDGVNIQDYLQQRLIDAYVHLADRLREAGGLFDECIIGWESMNEPSEGFITFEDLNNYPAEQTLKRESCPTPIQGLRLGSGIAQTVEYWTFKSTGPSKNGTIHIDPKGQTIWLSPEDEPDGVSKRWGWKRDSEWKLGTCVWEQHGVWDKASGNALKPAYFKYSKQNKGKTVDFVSEYWYPFWKKWTTRIRECHPEAILFVQPPLFKPPPKMLEEDLKGRAAYSPHYYDGLTMMTRHWNWFNASTLPLMRRKIHIVRSFKAGDDAIRKNFLEQLALFREDVNQTMGAFPVVIGETGTPFDVDWKRSYGRTDGGVYIGNHVRQQRALDASLGATDGNNVYNYTIWTYSPGHSWDHGDGFNGEDLSIWSSDDQIYRRHVKFEKLAHAAANQSMPSISMNGEPAPFQPSASSGSLPEIIEGLPLPKTLTAPASTAYEFLVDGARAIAAFCRPYPVKTVGRPKYLSYHIAKASFSMQVEVGPDDVTVEMLPTEIYLPLTTFASPPTLLPFPTETGEDGGSSPSSPSPPLSASPPQLPSPKAQHTPNPLSHLGHHAPKRQHTVQEAISRLHLAFAGDKSKAAAGYSLHLTSDPPLPLQVPDDILEIDVTVSTGVWEVKGQNLLWYYDAPEKCTETYSITVAKKNPRVGAAAREGSGEGCIVM